MATFRKIHTKFWSDPYVQSLSPEKKFFFLYLLTNEKTRQCGIYEITTRQISFDTGYNVETVVALLEYFIQADKIKVSRETNEISIKNWNKYNENQSPKTQKLVIQEIGTVKNRSLIEYIYSSDTVSILHHQEEEEKEKEEEVGSDRIREIANEVWKDQSWREQMCIGLSISMEELKKWLAMFNASASNDRIPDFNKSKYKKFARGWIVKRMANGMTVETGTQKKSDSAPLSYL